MDYHWFLTRLLCNTMDCLLYSKIMLYNTGYFFVWNSEKKPNKPQNQNKLRKVHGQFDRADKTLQIPALCKSLGTK